MKIRAGLGWDGQTEIKQAVLLVVRYYWEKGTLQDSFETKEQHRGESANWDK